MPAASSSVARLIVFPSGNITVRRKNRLPSDAAGEGSPSPGNQIRFASRCGSSSANCVGASTPIHLAFQSPGFSSPMLHDADLLQGDACPRPS
ncbi:MAG: hypothetical protein WCP12_12675, partial [bacterium]